MKLAVLVMIHTAQRLMMQLVEFELEHHSVAYYLLLHEWHIAVHLLVFDSLVYMESEC
jgi:hypothetical protein